MNDGALTTTQGTLAGAILPPSLYESFVAYVDRSERTTQTYLTNLRQFVAWTRWAGVTQPKRADILAYRAWLLREHDAIKIDPEAPEGWSYRGGRITCSANTAAQYLRTVRQFFAWAAAEGYYPNIAENIHAPKVDHSRHRKEALAPSEVLTIERSIERQESAGTTPRAREQARRLYALYLLAVNAGLRCVELSRANVRDLERRRGQAALYVHGKGHTEADTKKPLAPEVYDAIRAYLDARETPPAPDTPLFVATGNRSGGRRLAPRTISQMLKGAMKGAGIDSERITAHSLRHTAGTSIHALSGNLYQTQQYMRHANPATTEIYLHNDNDEEQGRLAAELFRYYHREGQ